jgi:ribA/ribD-fused uncharacterized protein
MKGTGMKRQFPNMATVLNWNLNVIDDFDGNYAFLSNFHPSQVVYMGITCATVEHAYQCAKATNEPDRFRIATAMKDNRPAPGLAKSWGRVCRLRRDWEEVKDDVMLTLLRQKFKHKTLRLALDATDAAYLIEGNNWNDTYWGVTHVGGKNRLGQMLMQVREENRKEGV